MSDLSERFRKLKSNNAKQHEFEKMAGDVDLAEEGKEFWKKKATALDKLVRGTRLMLAACAHTVGGEIIIDQETLELMDSGDFVMEQQTSEDPIHIRITVARKANHDGNPEEKRP